MAHIRKGKFIDGEDFKSINKAKKESRRLQLKEDQALGRGSVVVKKK